MRRNLKLLCPTLLVALVTAAVMAPTSQAGHFISEEKHTNLGSFQVIPVLLIFGSGATQCTTVDFAGTTEAQTVTALTLSSAFTECTEGEKAVEVAMNSCHFQFTITNSSPHNQVSIQCTFPGDVIEIEVPGFCTTTIPVQTPTSGGAVYTNGVDAGKHDIRIELTMGAIHYYTHGFCNLFKPTTTKFTDGAITGVLTLRGFDSKKNRVGITAT